MSVGVDAFPATMPGRYAWIFDASNFTHVLSIYAGHFLDVLFHLKYSGAREIACDAPFTKGQEMGWFELGSTIIVFAPPGFELCPGVAQGATVKMGRPLLRMPPA